MIEGPEEIDPKHLAQGIRVEGLLRNPESYIQNEDGTKTHIVPDASALEWSKIPLIADPSDCEHGFSCCMDCTNDWEVDYFIRILVQDTRQGHTSDWIEAWRSVDHPDADPNQGDSPL